MELVQWIVPLEDGSLAVGWAPVWADRMPSLGRLPGPVRRRGAPLVSRWLPCPLAAGVLEDTALRGSRPEPDAPVRLPLRPGALAVTVELAADGDEARSLLPADADDVRFAGLFSELVRVMADLAEAAGLPAAGIVPTPDRRGLELSVGALGSTTAWQLADALVLWATAFEMCAQARGLQVRGARVRLDDKVAVLDGKLSRFLARKEAP